MNNLRESRSRISRIMKSLLEMWSSLCTVYSFYKTKVLYSGSNKASLRIILWGLRLFFFFENYFYAIYNIIYYTNSNLKVYIINTSQVQVVKNRQPDDPEVPIYTYDEFCLSLKQSHMDDLEFTAGSPFSRI